MAERSEATPGTAFVGPIYITNEDGDITGQVATAVDETVTHEPLATIGDTSNSDQSDDINDNFATLLALITDIADAVGITVAEEAGE